jgi:hypothetical protein
MKSKKGDDDNVDDDVDEDDVGVVKEGGDD